MEYQNRPYFHVARASQLTGKDRVIYKLFEILPGFLSWASVILAVVLSFFIPVYVALFIIVFDLFWLFKTVYLSIHLRHNWKRMRYNMKLDWSKMLEKMRYDHIVHLVLLPFYSESFEVIEQSIKSLLSSKYDKKKMAVVVASEERAGPMAAEIANRIKEKYGEQFGYFITTVHPKDLPDEAPGKGSNISYAAEQARIHILDKHKIRYEDVIVSAFDMDTLVYPQYFLCLTWYFLTTPNPYKVSFQPVPLYNNNIWQAPAFSRVVAMSSTFWQMIQQERPERLATFSSHAVCFRNLYEIGYWQKNMVSEDSRIFWNLFLAHDGDYSVVPISYPVSMDANLAPTFWQTMRNVYKQHRRWTWGVENVPYILFGFVKNKKISLEKKIRLAFVQLEGFWSLATNPLLIFFCGWLPIIVGGRAFNSTVLSRSLPMITRDLMILSMCGLILSAFVCMTLLPPLPPGYGRRHQFAMILQWVLVPISIILFGALPGLESQTRLMFSKYLGFWVTPKFRKESEVHVG
ncbi:glycosyltransferase family 2 protein [Candidatus Parcubacteria bacterium]|nr:glycosyltransferase family 2 protein [Candidatus Parcubacteria bacterium]